MTSKRLHLKCPLALSALVTFFWLGTPAKAQTAPAQKSGSVQDNDTTRQQLVTFDQFLDSHPKLAEQIHRDPSLVNNDEFVKNHPTLQNYLEDHPGVREEIKGNPNGFTEREALHERHADNIARDRDQNPARDQDRDFNRNRDGLHRQFGEFLGGHSNVAQQLSKDPSLVKNREFMANHPDLREFLSSHPDVQQQLMRNPESFVNLSQKFSSTNGGGTVKPASPTTDPAGPIAEPKPKQ